MPKKCIVCGGPARNLYCSKACEATHKQNIKSCVVCGKEFPDAPSNDSVCCSMECSRVHKAELHKAGIYNDPVNKMLSGKQEFFRDHSGEKHINAKHWTIQSPSGDIYECQNLMHFIRTHPDLFDGTPKQAFDGFAKIKASQQGKRKNPSYSWKGWELIGWDD